MPCQSPCNSLILPVVKPNGLLRMVQDLRAVNAVVPIYFLMANPYSILTQILTQIPKEAKWFTLLNLKDVFFWIQVHFLSQCLFAFEWTDPRWGPMQRYTWAARPQGFQGAHTGLPRPWEKNWGKHTQKKRLFYSMRTACQYGIPPWRPQTRIAPKSLISLRPGFTRSPKWRHNSQNNKSNIWVIL